MPEIRSNPCNACPYRCDVPSGLWAEHEYEKLREYDEPTMDQPFAHFACHATPEKLCNGWAVVHNNRGHQFELIALRILGVYETPTSDIALFASGNEAADWGERDIENPSPEAMDAVAKLMKKYERLRDE
jgi:hypothetical protein